MGCMVNGSDIVLSGDVGDMGSGFYDDDSGFSASDVIIALAQVGDDKDITIRLNSGGGIAWEGSAIHSAIARHKGKVTIVVEGIAASAASVIAMAGDDVEMSLGAMLMVHDPSGFTVGTVKDHQDQINCLDALGASIASVYAAKSGRSAADCRADMTAETWMTAERAVELGYADRVGAEATPAEPAPFAYRNYRHAPEAILALADARQWNRKPIPQASVPVPKGNSDMTEKTGAKNAKGALRAAAAEPVTGVAADAAAASIAPVEGKEAVVVEPANNRADAADLVELCVAAGAPTMAAALIREGVSLPVARQRVDAAGKIKDVVALARRVHPTLAADYADTAIAANKSVTDVKAELFDGMAAADEKLITNGRHLTGAGSADEPGRAETARARSSATASMKRELKRQTGRPAKEA